MYWPALHMGCALQVSLRWPSSSWYSPSGHALHVRAAVVLSAEIFSPLPHVVCGLHTSAPPVANVLLPHTAHVMSLLAVAAALTCSPAGHGWRTALHALPSLSSEYVVPTSHASHLRSCVAVPSSFRPLPS